MLARLQEVGWDLGHDDGVEGKPPPAQEKRLERIYQHARRALYASIDRTVLRDVTFEPLPVRSEARSRDDYLMHPAAGERIRPEDGPAIRSMYPVERPAAQIVISDGLNADAVSENLRTVLPLLRRRLTERGVAAGGREIVIENGRVRAGYHAGQLLGVDVIIHLIGERPGTGLNTLSAYVTYGRDERGECAGASTWTTPVPPRSAGSTRWGRSPSLPRGRSPAWSSGCSRSAGRECCSESRKGGRPTRKDLNGSSGF
jgi:hypothetical protein